MGQPAVVLACLFLGLLLSPMSANAQDPAVNDTIQINETVAPTLSGTMRYSSPVPLVKVPQKPPVPKYIIAEKTLINGGRQWLYCYDENAVPPAKVWWDVWWKNATTVPGVVLADEGQIGNRSYANITFIMDKRVHQLPFTCNAKNDVAHETKSINMRFESLDYDPLQLKIIVKDTYGMMYKVQNDSLAVTDTVYSPMDQFGTTGYGYYDPNVIIYCHMTGNPYGTDLELVHDDPYTASDVPLVIKQCENMQVAANIVYCRVPSYDWYADYQWQCRAKQQNPETKAVTSYTKKLDFVKVESKIRIRMKYYKWYSYNNRYLTFYMTRGGVALIRCDAKYDEGGRVSEIPFPHQYEFYLVGQNGLPHFAKQEGNTLTISDIPDTLNNKEIVCFVRPQNASEIPSLGIGQRYFKIIVFTIPERPNIVVTIKDTVNSSLIIRNPDIVDLRRDGQPIELTCTLQNYDAEVDINSDAYRYLDWVKCKNFKCLYDEREAGTATEVSGMKKRFEGGKVTLTLQTGSVENSGVFMCVAVRSFINVSGVEDLLIIQSVPIKAFVLTRPGEIDDEEKSYGRISITKSGKGDIYFECLVAGYPYPDLDITRRDADNVQLETPRWIRQFEKAYHTNSSSNIYGSQLVYKLPKENIGRDNAYGTYVCSAQNSLGKAEFKSTWDAERASF